MSRATRVSAIRRHLVQGGLVDFGLGEARQKATPPSTRPTGSPPDSTSTTAGTLLVIVGAYGPDWFTTMREARHRLEQPYIKCHVDGEAPRLADNELLVRWATSAELQARAAIQEASQAPLKALLRQGEAQQQRAEEQRQALEDAGQSGLFRRHRPRSCALRGPPFLRPPTLARALSSRCATPAQVCPVGLRRPPQHERGPYAGCRRRTFTLKQPQLPAGCFR